MLQNRENQSPSTPAVFTSLHLWVFHFPCGPHQVRGLTRSFISACMRQFPACLRMPSYMCVCVCVCLCVCVRMLNIDVYFLGAKNTSQVLLCLFQV